MPYSLCVQRRKQSRRRVPMILVVSSVSMTVGLSFVLSSSLPLSELTSCSESDVSEVVGDIGSLCDSEPSGRFLACLSKSV